MARFFFSKKPLLEKAGISIINEGIRKFWNPTHDTLKKCQDLGKEITNN